MCLTSTHCNRKLSGNKCLQHNFTQLEINFVFLELDECLMACVLWQEECENKANKLMKKIKNLEDIMKEIQKEYEDKDGSKGEGFVQEISRLMKIFKDRW